MLGRKKKSHVLKEPAKIRAHWEYDLPKNFSDGSDYVTFEAKPLKGICKTKKTISSEGAACYSGIRPNYNQYEVLCTPREKARLSEEMFFESFNIFVEQGVISELIEARVEKGVPQLYSPGKGLTNQEIYTALCWYRWCDSHPALIDRFVKLWNDKRYPWNIFQLLVHGIAHHIGNCNHSFINAKAYASHEPWANPLLGVAAKSYFDAKDKCLGSRLGSDGHVNARIDEICSSFSNTASIPIKGKGRWGGEADAPTFRVEHIEDILSPRFIELYEMEQPTKKELQAALKGIFGHEA